MRCVAIGKGKLSKLLCATLHNQSAHVLEMQVSNKLRTFSDSHASATSPPPPLLWPTQLLPQQHMRVALLLPASAPACVVVECKISGLGVFEQVLKVGRESDPALLTDTFMISSLWQLHAELLPANADYQDGKKTGRPGSVSLGQVVSVRYHLTMIGRSDAKNTSFPSTYRLSISPVISEKWACIGCGSHVIPVECQAPGEGPLTLAPFQFKFAALCAGHSALPSLKVIIASDVSGNDMHNSKPIVLIPSHTADIFAVPATSFCTVSIA